MCHQAPRIFRDSLFTDSKKTLKAPSSIPAIPQGHTLVRETIAPCDPGSLKYRGLCTDPGPLAQLVDS